MKEIDQDLINLTSIRALYQEHLEGISEATERTTIYELQKQIRQRKEECKELGYDASLLSLREEQFNRWLISQLGKGVAP